MIQAFVIVKTSVFINSLTPFLRKHGIQIVSVCNNSVHALEEYKKYKTDLVIMDANWSNRHHTISGSELVDLLRTDYPSLKIIGVTNFPDKATAERLQQSGVNGYFSCSNELNTIVECITQVYEGNAYFVTDDTD